MKEVRDAWKRRKREGLRNKKNRSRKKEWTRDEERGTSDVREEGRGRDLLEERLSQVVPGQSLIRFKSN